MNGRPTDPFERSRLEPFRPNPHLSEHFSRIAAQNRAKKARSPDAGSHNLAHFRMMSRVISSACESLRDKGTDRCTAVILGAKECADVPLERLAGEGCVYLVDVDVPSLHEARNRVDDPSGRDRIEILPMDASLFANGLLLEAERRLLEHPSDIGRAFQALLALNREAGDRDPAGPFTKAQLPIRDDSVDLVVSSMTLSQFTIGYIQVLVEMLLDQYGREKTRRTLLPGSGAGNGLDGAGRIEELQRSTTGLARRAAESHVRELARVVRPAGLVVLSDHALHGRCVPINEGEVKVDVPSLIPYSKNPAEDRTLRFREDRGKKLPAALQVDRTRPDASLVVEGRDALKSTLGRESRIQILDERGWWWVTERAKETEDGDVLWNISYVEAFTLTPRRGDKTW